MPCWPARSRPILTRLFSPTLATLLIATSTGLALGAELRLPETLLADQRDRGTATITAVVDHIGSSVHSLREDCDLHVPLPSREIRVPFIGELKNACLEKPPGTSRGVWSDRLYEERPGLTVAVTGAFRIWLEHPPPGNAIQTEGTRVPWYANSNPDYHVELRPLVRVGSLNSTAHLKRLQKALALQDLTGGDAGGTSDLVILPRRGAAPMLKDLVQDLAPPWRSLRIDQILGRRQAWRPLWNG